MSLSPTIPIKLGPQAPPYARHLVETCRIKKSGPDRNDSVSELFRELGAELGLLVRHRPKPNRRYFEIDLNDLVFLIDPTPERLYSLVKLATQVEQGKDSGIHVALLRATSYWGDLRDFASGARKEVIWYTDSYVASREGSKAEDAEMRRYLDELYKLTEGVPGNIGESVPRELVLVNEGTPVSLRDYLEMYGYNLTSEVLLKRDVIPVSSFQGS